MAVNPSMTRRHFELIARVIKAHGQQFSHAETVALAEAFARELEDCNSGFDAARFLKACGVKS